MSEKPTISPSSVIKIFNDTLVNEFNVRLYGETELKKELLTKILTLSKTVRLSTLFTKSGLEFLLDTLDKDKGLFNFIIDLTDVFTFRIASFEEGGVEINLIRQIAQSISYSAKDGDLCLYGKSFSESFTSQEDIQKTIMNNRWLLTVVMFRFLDDMPAQQIEKTAKKSSPSVS